MKILRRLIAALVSCQFLVLPVFAEPVSHLPPLGDKFWEAPSDDCIEWLRRLIRPLISTRENGLLFAERCSSNLTFDKPSDIIDKITRGREARIFSHFHLYGPFELWNAESSAFALLLNCMPETAWRSTQKNPFVRDGINDVLNFRPGAALSSNYIEYDFGLCLRERSGSRLQFLDKLETIPDERARLHGIADKAIPVLRGKFASFLREHRCFRTGPDDCVLIMRLWASMSPSDTGLAEAIQYLEPNVAPDGPLPELRHSDSYHPASKREDGEKRFDLALRRAAFLRAKLLSVLNAPRVWPDDALQNTLRQLSNLRQIFAAAFVHRWQEYRLDSNDPINPWLVLHKRAYQVDPAKPWRISEPPWEREDVNAAILAELKRLSSEKDVSCDVFHQWFEQRDATGVTGPGSNKFLRTRYVLERLRQPDESISRCGIGPDFEWLRQQADTEHRDILYGYLALLDHLPEAEKNSLARGLTEYGALCAGKGKTLPGWLQKICSKGFSLHEEYDDDDHASGC